MTCEDYLRMLDETEPGAPAPGAFLRHAESCEDCTWALHLAKTLESAPHWSPKVRLPLEARAQVLAKAKMRLLFWRDTTSVLVESVVTALVVVGLAAAAFFGLPSVLKSLIPVQAREIIQSYAAPVLDAVGGFLGAFSPLFHSSMGLALMLGAGFTVLVAAIASTRLLMPSWQV